MIYNVALVSGAQHSDSVRRMYVFFFAFFFIIGYYVILNAVPRALQQDLVYLTPVFIIKDETCRVCQHLPQQHLLSLSLELVSQ